MIRAVVCAMALLILGCETTPKTSAASQSQTRPRDHLLERGRPSVEQAVVITGEANSSSGMRTGYSWLAQRYPGHKRRSQSLITVGQRAYDRFEIRDGDGHSMVLYFDITVFFGELK